MLWRIGGGTSRGGCRSRATRSPTIPGHGTNKINAAYAFGGPALTIKTVEPFTGIKINHLIIVNLAHFPKFIDAIGGIDVKTGRICSEISGGVKNGGFTLNLRPGRPPPERHARADARADAREHAATRPRTTSPASAASSRSSTRSSQPAVSRSTFFRLPWASWDAPKALRTDMGGFTLLSLFAAVGDRRLGAGAGAQADRLRRRLPDGESALTISPATVHSAVTKLLHG